MNALAIALTARSRSLAHRLGQQGWARHAALAIFVPFLTFGLSAVPARATTIERIVSPGGIVAWLVREPAVPLITMDFAFEGGAVQDPSGKAGTGFLMSSLLDEGAGDFDQSAFQDRLDRKAVQMSFRVDRDHLTGTLRTLSENRDEAFDDLRLALTAPRFDSADVELNRAQILSTLRRQQTSPTDLAALRWWSTAFAGHPYGRPVGGTLESVPTITIDDLRAYQHRVLARDTLKVAIVGDIDTEAAKAMLDRVFGALPAKAELTSVESVVAQGVGRRISIDLDVPQTVINFGCPGIARKDPDFFAAYLVNDILGGGTFSSRLYREVREKRGLVYSIYDSLLWFEHSGLFYGSTATRADRADETVGLIDKEVHRLAEDGPTADELAKAKAYLDGAFVLNLDTSTKVAGLLLQLQIDNLGTDYIERRPQMIAAVTLDDTRRVAKRMLDAGLLFTVVGRPAGLASGASGQSGAAHPALIAPGSAGGMPAADLR